MNSCSSVDRCRPGIRVITLGCSKNLVDTEHLLAQVKDRFEIFPEEDERPVDYLLINTCGFIGDAKEESIRTILEAVELKKAGKVGTLLVFGCLSQRYLSEMPDLIPEVDGWYGARDLAPVVRALGCRMKPRLVNDRVRKENSLPYAYLKISEGCDRKCAYCAIPIITGSHKSRPMEEILDEVRELVADGVSEFQVIAQELTYYGIDLYKEQRLPQLIEAMAQIPGVRWIRLHYAYPTHFPKDLLRVMREYPNVCNYLDIALQHIADPVLQRMQRHITKAETLALLQEMRREVPGICIRTTLMVGFPGETEEDFNELLEFVREVRFDRMGAFAYSEEEGTYAALNYEDDVPEEVKQARLDKLMSVQERISAELCAAKVGQRVTVVIDRREGDYYIGRTEADSPEVDCEVLVPVNEQTLQTGAFYTAEITGADEFDLYATIED